MQVEVAVLGGGNAALCAAINAARAGCSVLLLESAPKPWRGGNSRHTRNFRCMHQAPIAPLTDRYLEDEYFDDLIKVTKGKTDEALARKAIRLRSDLALNAEDPSDHLTALDREARRAGTLASQLVHLESALEVEDLEPVELMGLLQGLVEDWHAPCRQAEVTLSFVALVESAPILGNASLIEEVLSNLLDNALAHADATTVTVTVDALGFTVADNGKGVGEAELTQIFERFYSGDSAQGVGHGLGLSIVREFANRMQAEARAWVAEGLHLSLRFKPATL